MKENAFARWTSNISFYIFTGNFICPGQWQKLVVKPFIFKTNIFCTLARATFSFFLLLAFWQELPGSYSHLKYVYDLVHQSFAKKKGSKTSWSLKCEH